MLESRRRRGVRIALPRGPSHIYNDYPYYYARGYYPRHIGGYVYYPLLLHPLVISMSLILLSARALATAIVAVRSEMQRKPLNVETCKARLDEIEARLKRGNLNAAEADAARLALLSQLRSSSWGIGQGLRRASRTLIVPAAVFLVIAGVGAAVSQLADTPEAPGAADTNFGAGFRIGWRHVCKPHGLHAFGWSRRSSVYAGGWQTAA